MLRQFRENTPLILQLGILLIGVIIILTIGIIVWLSRSQPRVGNDENTTSVPVTIDSSLEHSPEQQPPEVPLTETQTQATPLPTTTMTATNTTTPTHTPTLPPTLPPATPTSTIIITPTVASIPTQAPIKCVTARNINGNGFRILKDPGSESIVAGALPNARLGILMGTVPEGDWWFVRLDRGVEGWAYLGPLTTGTLIEVLPSCDE